MNDKVQGLSDGLNFHPMSKQKRSFTKKVSNGCQRFVRLTCSIPQDGDGSNVLLRLLDPSPW